MSKKKEGKAKPPNELYDAKYYATHCGPVAYDRSSDAWAALFGNMADELIRLFQPVRVFDAGCAHGFLVEALWDRGVQAWGRDISEFAISQVRADIKQYCSVGNLTETISGRFDLVVCIEVLEHMSEADGVQAIANMTAVTDRIVFSSSPTDLTEPTHVNVKPTIYWLRLFAAQHFAPAAAISLSVAPHALVFNRTDIAPRDEDLIVCAELVRARLQVAERAHTIQLLSETVAERDRSAATREGQIAQADSKIASLEERSRQEAELIANLQNQIEQRDQQLAEFGRSAADVQDQIAERDQMIGQLTAMLSAQTAELELLAADFNRLVAIRSDEIAEVKRESSNLRKFVEESSEALRDRDNEIADLVQAVIVARDQLDERNRTIASQTAEISKRDGTIDHFSSQIAHRDSALRLAHAELDAAVAAKRRDEAEIVRLRAEQQAIFQSTTWRFFVVLRWILQKLPAQLRRKARAALQRTTERKRRKAVSLETREAGDASVIEFVVAREEEELIQNSGLFDPDWYSSHYPDASSDPFRHFIEKGLKENLNPNPLFDAKWYLQAYPDVAAAGINPLLHFIQWGHLEGRWPSLGFNSQWYRETYPDAVSSNDNCLAHYLRVGKGQGLLPLDPNADYMAYILDDNQLLAFERPELELHAQLLIFPIRFLILISDGPKDQLVRTRENLKNQIYKNYLVVEEKDELKNIRVSSTDFLIWMRNGDTLHPRTLYEFASALNANIDLDMVYSDSDRITSLGRRSKPFCKPDWSPDYLESMNYIGPACCYRASLSAAILLNAPCQYDLLLRFTEQSERIGHIRKILYHQADDGDDAVMAIDGHKEILALQGRLSRTGRTGTIQSIASAPGVYDLKLKLRNHPLVSVIVFRAAVEDPSLDNYVRSLVESSAYKNLQLIVVTESKMTVDKLAALESRGCTVVNCENGSSMSARLGIGLQAAKGELILLKDDDLEPTSADWIARMVEQFEKPHVGIVGPKILNPDGTIKSAGIVFSSGNPVNVLNNQQTDVSGYFFNSLAARNYSAVSGTCIMARTACFLKAYADATVPYTAADFCVKIRSYGKFVVYAPRAELIDNSLSLEPCRCGTNDDGDLQGYSREYDPFDNVTVDLARNHPSSADARS